MSQIQKSPEQLEFEKEMRTQVCQIGIVMLYSVVESGIKELVGSSDGYLQEAVHKVLPPPLLQQDDNEKKRLRNLLDGYMNSDDPAFIQAFNQESSNITLLLHGEDIEELRLLANDIKHYNGVVTNQKLKKNFGWNIGSVIGGQEDGNQSWETFFSLSSNISSPGRATIYLQGFLGILEEKIKKTVVDPQQQEELIEQSREKYEKTALSKLDTLSQWVIDPMYQEIPNLVLPNEVDTSQYSDPDPTEKAFCSYCCSIIEEVGIINKLVNAVMMKHRQDQKEAESANDTYDSSATLDGQQTWVYRVAIVLLYWVVERNKSKCAQYVDPPKSLLQNDIEELKILHNFIKHNGGFIFDPSELDPASKLSENCKYLRERGYIVNDELDGQRAKGAFERIYLRVPVYLACRAKEAGLNL